MNVNNQKDETVKSPTSHRILSLHQQLHQKQIYVIVIKSVIKANKNVIDQNSRIAKLKSE